jgi:hypothetical protein
VILWVLVLMPEPMLPLFGSVGRVLLVRSY